MEEIKVGEFVRTRLGEIAKIAGTNMFDKTIYKDIKGYSYYLEHIEKHSFNIIDLIEVGDYVNAERVIKKNCHLLYWDDDEREEIDIDDGIQLEKGWIYFEEDIENIVTKEEFKSVMYEVK